MDCIELENSINELKTSVKKGDVYYDDSKIKKQFSDIIRNSIKILPEKRNLFQDIKTKVMDRHHGPFGSDILNNLKTIADLLNKDISKAIKDQKTFLSPEDLLKKAGQALRENNESYAISLCDSAIEAFLKHHFDVPSTIVGAGTVKFLSECMVLKIPQGIELYLKECKNKVSQIDNQVKHKAYVPTRLDAINAIKATEELLARKNTFSHLTMEEKRKVQAGIGVIKK